MQVVAALIAGFIFGLGILVSGMGNPAKVTNFFDFAGTWDPSLVFVMGGALVVTGIGYRLAFAAGKPLFDRRFHLPGSSAIDLPLIAGSAVFGLGWGITGFCPGGLIPVLAIGRLEPIIFCAAMIVGLVLARAVRARSAPLLEQTSVKA